MRQVRLFFAFLPDAPTCERVANAATRLGLGPNGQLVGPDNFHVTLAFIGGVSEQQVTVAQAIGSAQRARQFVLRFDAYEYWPKPEVVVAAARAIPAPLENFWTDLHRSLARSGWALDAKRLRPHVTLARKVSQTPVLQAMSEFDWRVMQFSLMRSSAVGTCPAYTVVDTWPLLYDSGKT